MGMTKHVFKVHDARRIAHPTFPGVEKHWFTVRASDLPLDISTKANARDPEGLNRRVYRDVRDSLQSGSGMFDLMNKGITILAKKVRVIDKHDMTFEVTVDDDEGIVDGGHTAKLIWDAQENDIPDNQYVEVYIKVGIEPEMIVDIARGLNTGMQVREHSLFNLDGVFDWLKDEISNTEYADDVAWSESDNKEHDVRELIAILECFNVFDYPNDQDRHPVSAYEKWSMPLSNFGRDYRDKYKIDSKASTYHRLRPILRDALALHDHIRRSFRDFHNEAGGKAGALNIVEQAPSNRLFRFSYAGLPDCEYRLMKGPLYPILAAFRNCVEVGRNGNARWAGGFNRTLQLWNAAAPELVAFTVNVAKKDYGSASERVGKARGFWSNVHDKVALKLLRLEKLDAAE